MFCWVVPPKFTSRASNISKKKLTIWPRHRTLPQTHHHPPTFSISRFLPIWLIIKKQQNCDTAWQSVQGHGDDSRIPSGTAGQTNQRPSGQLVLRPPVENHSTGHFCVFLGVRKVMKYLIHRQTAGCCVRGCWKYYQKLKPTELTRLANISLLKQVLYLRNNKRWSKEKQGVGGHLANAVTTQEMHSFHRTDNKPFSVDYRVSGGRTKVSSCLRVLPDLL